MSQLDENRRGVILSTLMDEKLGPWRFWRPPEIADHVGPRDTGPLERFDQHREKIVDACHQKLCQFTDEQLLVLVTPSMDDPDDIGNEWHGWLKSEIYELKLQIPSWTSVGFGHPGFLADFEYWGQMEKLSLHESLLLSVGIEPKHYDENRLAKALSDRRPERFKPTLHFLLKRYDVFTRKFPFGGAGYMRVRLPFLKEWFDEIEMTIHPGFRELLERRCPQKDVEVVPVAIDNKLQNDQGLSSIERDSLLKLIAAMACEGYRYDPNALRNTATKDIQDDVSKIGHSVDPKTVLKWLRLAVEQIDEGYWAAKKD